MNLGRGGEPMLVPTKMQMTRSGSKVKVQFTEPIDTIAFTAEEARKVAETLVRLATDAETRNK